MDIYPQSNQIKSRKDLKRDWNINITKKTHSWIKERFETYIFSRKKPKNPQIEISNTNSIFFKDENNNILKNPIRGEQRYWFDFNLVCKS
jgi:hypothetical protein